MGVYHLLVVGIPRAFDIAIIRNIAFAIVIQAHGVDGIVVGEEMDGVIWVIGLIVLCKHPRDFHGDADAVLFACECTRSDFRAFFQIDVVIRVVFDCDVASHA